MNAITFIVRVVMNAIAFIFGKEETRLHSNLLAEMARNGVTKTEIAKTLGVRYATVIDKTNGKSRFYYDEAVKIKKELFPNCSLEYLFSSDSNPGTI